MTPGLRASYVLLEAGDNGYRIEQRSVDYDRLAVMRAVEAVRFPGARYVASFINGERRPHWMAHGDGSPG
jgi:hypothetical protein